MPRHAVPARAAGWVAMLAALGIAAMLAGCGGSPTTIISPSTSLTPVASPTASGSPSPSELKPVLAGLLDRSGPPPASYVTSLAGYVVNAYWRDLQPTPAETLAPDNAIDQAITEVRSLNAADHTHLALKIRVYAGVWAPQWAKQLGGAPVSVTNPQGGATGTVGRFWTAAFGAAYNELESLLAAKYDTVSEIREVTISRCTTFYDEPFIRDAGDPATIDALIAAGYTTSADETCQREEIDAATVWHHTHSDLALNPYEAIGPGGGVVTDELFTESMMEYCRQVLGDACVLENNSLRYPVQGASYESMYASMSLLGAPLAFQTATASRVGDLTATLAYAVSLGANSVELPGGYAAIGTPATFASATRLLAANHAA